MSEEIEARLEQSEQMYESFGGVENYRLMQVIAGAIMQIEETTGKSWRTDLATRGQVQEAANTLLRVFSSEADKDAFLLAAFGAHPGLGRRAAVQQIERQLAVLKLARALAGDAAPPPDKQGK